MRNVRCPCNSLKLRLASLACIVLWRNILYPLMSCNWLELCCPKTLGSLSPGEIPPHVSRLLTMVAHHLSRPSGNSHLSYLTGNSHMSLARMAVTLRSSRTRGSLPLPRTGGRLTVLPLATNTRIPSVPSILHLSLYGQGRPNHRIHIL